MAVSPRLLDLLERCRVRYEIVPHAETETATQAARHAHAPTRNMAKVVVLRDRFGADLMVAVPSSHHVDPHRVQVATGRSGIHLEDENELARIFPDCEVGAMPPVGHLYGLPLLVDSCLTEEDEIWFQPGNHHELIRMATGHFHRLAGPFYDGMCLGYEPSLTPG